MVLVLALEAISISAEAAAANAVVAVLSIPQSNVKVTIDRPFLFFIVDPSTNAVVFAGSITSLS